MKHLIRGGLLLLIGVVAIVTLRALVLQGRITLADFGLRPPRQERSTADWADRPLEYTSSLKCAGGDCHEGIYELWDTSSHGSVACETCHGAAPAHVVDTELPVPVDRRGEVCHLCHARLIARPTDHPQIELADHYPETTCMACHKAHRPGPPPLITHEVFEGSDCLACHGFDAPPDRAVPPTHVGRTNDVCLTCHEG